MLHFASWDVWTVREVTTPIWIVWTEEWPGLTQGCRIPDVIVLARETFTWNWWLILEDVSGLAIQPFWVSAQGERDKGSAMLALPLLGGVR